MTQDIILEKMIKFLDLMQLQRIREMRKKFPNNYVRKVEEIKADYQPLRAQLEEGHCFALVVLHGAFDAVGKLPWWEEALLTIANWDEHASSLNTLIELTGSEEDAFWQTKEEREREQITPVNKKQIKLKVLFERVLGYLVHHQQENSALGNNQKIFLSPKNNYFELIKKDGTTASISIRKRAVLAGYFEQRELEKLFNEADFTETIGIIKETDHVIRVGFKEGKWLVYDPNYDHRSTKSMHRYFKTKTDLTKEIFRILGQTFAIEIASFDSEKHFLLPQVNSVPPEKIIQRLQDSGIHIILKYTPEELSNILDIAAKTTNGQKAIAQALASRNKQGFSGLEFMAATSETNLLKALDIAARAPNGKEAIAKALVSTVSGISNMQTIADASPKSLIRAFEYTAESLLKIDPKYLIQMLKFTAPPPQTLTKGLWQAHLPKLAYDAFIKAVWQYIAPTHEPRLFATASPCLDQITTAALLKINAATSDVKRYQLTLKFISEHPKNPFTNQLQKLIEEEQSTLHQSKRDFTGGTPV